MDALLTDLTTAVPQGVAAEVLLVTEAGGVVTDLRCAPWQPAATEILAAAPGVHPGLLSILKEN
jgi:myo-inositol-1(or 4)-monophosphatase